MLMARALLLALVLQAAISSRTDAAQIPGVLSRTGTLQTIGLEKARQLEFEARRKTAIVLTGHSVKPTVTNAHTINVIISAPPESEAHLGVALAAAIDRRGYFLTAAHVAAIEPLSLIFYDGKQLHASPARVVAKVSCLKHEADRKLDVAVLQVDAELDDVFEWADLSEIRRSAFLFQIGRAIHQSSDTHGIIGPVSFVGKFKKMIGLRGGGTAIRTDMPAARGDSGGPVLTLEGKLLGIECGSVRPFLRRGYELANRPDLNWLRDVTDRDSQPRAREPIAIERSRELDHASGETLTITVRLLHGF